MFHGLPLFVIFRVGLLPTSELQDLSDGVVHDVETRFRFHIPPDFALVG